MPHDINEILDFGTLEPVEVSVKIGDKSYVLREATAADAAAFKNAAMATARLEDGKMVGIGRAADAEAVLVGRCLLSQEDKTGAWKPVGEAFAKSLPSRITAKLYERARKISGLDADEEKVDAAGKGSPDSTASPST